MLVVYAIPSKQKHTIGMYIKEVGIEYRIEITLYDSFKLLTPVGMQDSHFRRYYTKKILRSLKQTKKIVFYQMGKYSFY